MSNWVYDGRFEYQGYHRTPAFCWLNIGKIGRGHYGGSGTVVIMTELPDSGLSVTNACEKIATKVVQEIFYPRDWPLHKAMWFEHYTEEERGRSLGESYDMVLFQWEPSMKTGAGLVATQATWRHVDRAFVEDLLGFPIDDLNNLARYG